MKRQIPLNDAVLECERHDVVEVRFRNGSTLTTSTIEEVLNARQRHFGPKPQHIVFIAPAEFQCDITAMTLDHCTNNPNKALTSSISWVTNSALTRKLVEVYYAHFPSPALVRVFDHENEMRHWLLNEMPVPSMS